MKTATNPEGRATRTAAKGSTGRRSLREMTRHYFAHEIKFQFVIEALLFAIIAAISAWPVLNAAGALHEFLERVTS
jgi:hypothetical protein